MHDNPDSRAAADRLDAAWDNLVRGDALGPPSTPNDVARLAMIARLDALAPVPDVAARASLRHRVFAARHQETAMPSHGLPSTPTGTVAPLTPPSAWGDRGRWRRPVAALQVIVAAALVLAAVATVLLVPRNDERPSLPAASSPKSNAATAASVNRGESLLTLGAPVLADTPMPSVVVQRITLPAGATWTYESDSREAAVFVETGQVVFGRQGQEYLTQAGRNFAVQGSSPDFLRAGGSSPATFVIGTLTPTAAPIPPAGSTVETIASFPVPPLEYATVVDVTLHRLDLSGDGVDPFPSFPGTHPMHVAVESGVLRVYTVPGALVKSTDLLRAISSPDAATNPRTPTPDTWMIHSGDEGLFVEAGEFVMVERPNDITRMEIVGEAPVGAFVVTVGVRLFADATPASGIIDAGSVTSTLDRPDGRAPGSIRERAWSDGKQH